MKKKLLLLKLALFIAYAVIQYKFIMLGDRTKESLITYSVNLFVVLIIYLICDFAIKKRYKTKN